MTLNELFENDGFGLLDGPIVISYKGYTYTEEGNGRYTVRTPEQWLMYENIDSIDECRRLIDSNIKWHQEAK